MRVIRTLSESGSVEDREEEKRKLEHKFRESDTKVDQVGVGAALFSHWCYQLLYVRSISVIPCNLVSTFAMYVIDLKLHSLVLRES